jgi:hypothetical protein
MRKGLLIIALGLFLTAGSAAADVLTVPETQTTPEFRLPAKGTSMADVEKRYGAPRAKRPPVGGDTPKQPPITRWEYDGFLVFFEHDKVVDAVVPGAPPAVYNKDELQPAPTAPPPPQAAMPATPAPAAAETPAGEPEQALTPAEQSAVPPAEEPPGMTPEARSPPPEEIPQDQPPTPK